MKNFPISKEGFLYIAILFTITMIVYYFSPFLSILPLILTLFVIFFFRNPNRKIIKNNMNIICPADGMIMEVKEIFEDSFLKTRATKISIFLSIFNVHVNKSPIDGNIVFTSYRPGKFLPAFKSHASDINEKNIVGIQNDTIKIIVSQITGFIARRIVCWVKEGDTINQGDNFGLIKFGSCVEIIVPDNVHILVKPKQKVKAGISIIGVIKHED